MDDCSVYSSSKQNEVDGKDETDNREYREKCKVFYYLGPCVWVLADLHALQLTAGNYVCGSPRLF